MENVCNKISDIHRGMYVGVGLGAVGYCIQIFNSGNLGLFILSLALIGLSEVITCMQTYVREEFGMIGSRTLRVALRVQYASNVAGTCFGFVGAGIMAFLSKDTELVSQGSFGLFLEVMELISLGCYMYMKVAVPFSEIDEKFTEVLQGSYDSSRVSRTSRTIRNKQKSLIRDVVTLLDDTQASDSQVTAELMLFDNTGSADMSGFMEISSPKEFNELQWINYAVAFTFAVQALMIGSILSTGPILLYTEYRVPLQYVGFLFGFGEFLGTLAMFYLIPGNSYLRNLVPGPFNIIVVQATIGTMACMLGLHVPILSMALMSFIMGLNDFGTSLIAETQGATISAKSYPRINMIGNVSRRAGNTLTAILGPILFHVSCHAPFLLFGVLMILWSIVLLLLFETRGVEVMTKIVDEQHVLMNKLSKPLAGLRYYKSGMSFVSTELDFQKKMRQRLNRPAENS